MAEYDPWSDDDCQTAFIELHAEDFDLWCMERGIHYDYSMDHEMDYCESQDDKFLEFAYNYHESWLDAQAEKRRESDENR